MKTTFRFALVLALYSGVGLGLPNGHGAQNDLAKNRQIVYVGTYTGAKSEGIYAFLLSPATSKLTPLGLVARAASPAFLAVHPNHRYLYAVDEISEYQGQKSGSISAFAIDRHTAKLTLLNTVPSGGSGPTHLVVDKTGRYILVANYEAGSVALLPILPDGRLGKATAVLPHTGHSIDPNRQKEPHAHSVYLSPDNRFAVSADLGTDQIYLYQFDAARGEITPNQPSFVRVAAGTGPRHFAFDPRAKFGYVIEEMGAGITAFSYDAAHCVLQPIQTISTLPADYHGVKSAAEIAIGPSDRFLYASNRGHDSIAVFAIDPGNGTLKAVEYVPTEGKTPRNFGIDLTGRYLIAANQDSSSLVMFSIDAASGRLTPTGEKVQVPSPSCVVFEPAD